MSFLAERTEKKAVRVLTRCVKLLDGMADLKVANLDDFDITQAKNLMKGIIESHHSNTIEPGKAKTYTV